MSESDSNPHTSFNLSKHIGEQLIEIEQKILELKKCSAEDFKNLSKIFKKNHTYTKQISNNISKFFNLIAEQKEKLNSDNLFSILKKRKNTLHRLLPVISSINSSNYFSNYTETDTFFSLSNLKQNLNSLLIVLENASLEMDTLNVSEKGSEKVLNELKKIIQLYIQDVNTFITKIKAEHSEHTNSKEYFINLDSLQNNIENAEGTIDELLKDRKQFINNNQDIVTDKITKANKSIGEIITNLQYDDIIRQKIEHIHQIQNEINAIILDEKDLKIEQGNLDDVNNVKPVIKIIEIINLLTAQLLHTNEAFQNANSEISGKLKDISINICELTDIGNQFVYHGKRSFIESVSSEFNLATQQKTECKKMLSALNKLSGNLDSKAGLMNELKSKITHSNQEMVALINDVTQEKYINIEKEQYKGLIESIQNSYSATISNLEEQLHNVSDILAIIPSEQDLKAMIDETDDIVNDIDTTNELFTSTNNLVLKHIEENNEICKSVTHDVDRQISEVTYYDFFEKSTDEIILTLKELHKELKSIIGDKHSQADLKYLEEYYSMESERLIHRSAISEEEQASGTNVPEEENDEDNLELF